MFGFYYSHTIREVNVSKASCKKSCFVSLSSLQRKLNEVRSKKWSIIQSLLRKYVIYIFCIEFSEWLLPAAELLIHPCIPLHKTVKVQFRGPEKKGALFQEESYLPRIFRSSSLNLHTFHLIHIVFWCHIFFRKHGKSTPNDREDHHVLVVDVVMMTSQCRCTRALSESHIAKHDNHVPVAPYGKIISSKTLKLHSNWGHPSTIVSSTCSWRHEYTR